MVDDISDRIVLQHNPNSTVASGGTWSILNRKKLVDKLSKSLTSELSSEFEKHVPAQTWIVYWITHSLALLEQKQFLKTISDDVIEFIGECAHKEGGYGGGPGQIAHLATSFAAINALITLNSETALDSIDRVGLVRFLHRMKQEDGSFTLHDDGEIDSRATYCALAMLRSLNINDPILLENVADWVLACQTYEGGFSSVPGSEAHGGYTFCCVASLCLLNQLDRANLPALLRWLTNKQLSDEGGFCGRSNKLVDSCYSYWQGAVFPLIHSHLEASLSCDKSHRGDDFKTRAQNKKIVNNRELSQNWIYDCEALQDYILNQCQTSSGLLRDKPTAKPDFYHTCYALSGLSLSQHQPGDNGAGGAILDIGHKQINILAPTHPLFNIALDSLNDCFEYFRDKKTQIERQDNDVKSI